MKPGFPSNILRWEYVFICMCMCQDCSEERPQYRPTADIMANITGVSHKREMDFFPRLPWLLHWWRHKSKDLRFSNFFGCYWLLSCSPLVSSNLSQFWARRIKGIPAVGERWGRGKGINIGSGCLSAKWWRLKGKLPLFFCFTNSQTSSPPRSL